MGYNSDEFGDVIEDKDTAEKVVEVSNINQQISDEVERRLEVAACYRLLLNESLFNDPSPTAKLVDDEIRGFIRSRLANLVGVGAPTTDSTFTAEEVQALKLLAQKAIPAFKKELPKPTLPSVRKVSTAQIVTASAKVVLPPVGSSVDEIKPTPTIPPPNRRKRQANPHAIKMPTGGAFEAVVSSQAQLSAQSVAENPINTQLVNSALQTKPTE